MALELFPRALKRVKKVVNLTDKKTYALKIINKSTIESNNLIEYLKKEIAVLRMMNHENIVRLYEVTRSFAKINLVLEYVDCPDLLSFMSNLIRFFKLHFRNKSQDYLSAIDTRNGILPLEKDIPPGH